MVTGVIVREPGLRRRARVMAHTIRVAVSMRCSSIMPHTPHHRHLRNLGGIVGIEQLSFAHGIHWCVFELGHCSSQMDARETAEQDAHNIGESRSIDGWFIVVCVHVYVCKYMCVCVCNSP